MEGAGSQVSAAAAGTVAVGDLTVNRMGFGAMRVTGVGVWGEPPDPAASKGVLRRVLELGVNFVDTADSYGPEVSELLLAEALYPYPEGLTIATKGGLLRSGPSRWERDCRPEHLREACEGSLRRLRVERIDVYQLHAIDDKVPLEESVGALAELREQGKVRHVGICNVGVEQLERARAIVPIVSVQNRYSLSERGSDEVVDFCEREGLPFLPWFPLDAGDLGARDALESVAAAHDATPYQVALAWLLRRSRTMLPIPGTSSLSHLEENVAAAGLELSDGELAELSEA